jgi:uncharacterized RDD family membrane protein YckC
MFSWLHIESRLSSISLVLLSVMAVAYKPFMESVYGATLGKMVLKLKVVNVRLEKASLGEILSRNIFHVVPFLISLTLTELFAQWVFSPIFDSSVTALTLIYIANFLVTIVDIVVLLGDKRYRSLHDRIGGTCVIEHGHGNASTS